MELFVSNACSPVGVEYLRYCTEVDEIQGLSLHFYKGGIPRHPDSLKTGKLVKFSGKMERVRIRQLLVTGIRLGSNG